MLGSMLGSPLLVQLPYICIYIYIYMFFLEGGGQLGPSQPRELITNMTNNMEMWVPEGSGHRAI